MYGYNFFSFYLQFLSEHGGSSNAFTSAEHTNYFFDVSPEHLSGALDRSASFHQETIYFNYQEQFTDPSFKGFTIF